MKIRYSFGGPGKEYEVSEMENPLQKAFDNLMAREPFHITIDGDHGYAFFKMLPAGVWTNRETHSRCFVATFEMDLQSNGMRLYIVVASAMGTFTQISLSRGA